MNYKQLKTGRFAGQWEVTKAEILVDALGGLNEVNRKVVAICTTEALAEVVRAHIAAESSGPQEDTLRGLAGMPPVGILTVFDRWMSRAKFERPSDESYAAVFSREIRKIAASLKLQPDSEKNAGRLDGLRKMMGHVQDGSDTAVLLYQDDATRSYIVHVGDRHYWGESFGIAIDNAIMVEVIGDDQLTDLNAVEQKEKS